MIPVCIFLMPGNLLSVRTVFHSLPISSRSIAEASFDGSFLIFVNIFCFRNGHLSRIMSRAKTSNCRMCRSNTTKRMNDCMQRTLPLKTSSKLSTFRYWPSASFFPAAVLQIHRYAPSASCARFYILQLDDPQLFIIINTSFCHFSSPASSSSSLFLLPLPLLFLSLSIHLYHTPTLSVPFFRWRSIVVGCFAA